MREIVLDQSFEQKVSEMNANFNISETVRILAKALEQLPADMAEEIIYLCLVTESLGGKQLDQEQLALSLLELRRIRAGKDDGFTVGPTEKWIYLENAREYQAVANVVNEQLDMGMLLHTISTYLKNNDADKIGETIEEMHEFKQAVEKMSKANNYPERDRDLHRLFMSELIEICYLYVGREEYLICFAHECKNVGEFEIAFADLFILMANEPLAYL